MVVIGGLLFFSSNMTFVYCKNKYLSIKLIFQLYLSEKLKKNDYWGNWKPVDKNRSGSFQALVNRDLAIDEVSDSKNVSLRYVELFANIFLSIDFSYPDLYAV